MSDNPPSKSDLFWAGVVLLSFAAGWLFAEFVIKPFMRVH